MIKEIQQSILDSEEILEKMKEDSVTRGYDSAEDLEAMAYEEGYQAGLKEVLRITKELGFEEWE